MKGLIQRAVEEELAEVIRIRAAATDLHALTRRGAELAAVIALFVSVSALVVQRRALTRPLTALLDGVQAIAAGDLSRADR